MVTTVHLQQQLTELFARHMNLTITGPEVDLIATGRLDSLALVDLLVRLEHEFGVQIELDDLEVDNFRSLSSIAAFLVRQQTAGRLTPVRLAS